MVILAILVGFYCSEFAFCSLFCLAVLCYVILTCFPIHMVREDKRCQSYVMGPSNFLRACVLLAQRSIRSSPMHTTYDTLSKPYLMVVPLVRLTRTLCDSGTREQISIGESQRRSLFISGASLRMLIYLLIWASHGINYSSLFGWRRPGLPICVMLKKVTGGVLQIRY